MQFYLVDSDQLQRLRALELRLFSEQRMDGDAMRDAAQTIQAIRRVCEQMPADDDQPDAFRAFVALVAAGNTEIDELEREARQLLGKQP